MRKGQDKQRTHNIQEEQEEQKKPNIFKRAGKFVSDHKGAIAVAGVGIAAVVVSVISNSSDDDTDDMSDDGSVSRDSYSGRYFRKSSIDELKEERNKVQQDYLNPDLDFDYRASRYDVLHQFDNAISEKEWDGKEPGYPVHSEHGWYLSSDD